MVYQTTIVNLLKLITPKSLAIKKGENLFTN